MSLRLKSLLADAGISCRELARALGMSSSALSNFINYGYLSSKFSRPAVEIRIQTFLVDHGVSNADTWHLDETEAKAEPPRANAAAPGPRKQAPLKDQPEETENMLLRKHTLTPQARRHFGLPGDPFADPTSADEVFLSPDIRYVRESIYQVARHGGFMAVVGESGAGKSTLREEMDDRIQREAQGVSVIEPYVLATEGKDGVGKPLRSQHLAEAIMACIDPLAKTKSSPEARFRQLHESLRQSARSGRKHVLVIEEAHSLPLTTLKHLKRFMELKDGLRPLLSIVLFAQPELLDKLSVANPEIREVMQRLEIVTLPALGAHLDDYVAQRFKRIGVPVEKVFDRDVLPALRARLTPSAKDVSLLYPLAVHNALAAAMNRTVDLGMPLVTGDVVKGV